jgi:hypothetical protein
MEGIVSGRLQEVIPDHLLKFCEAIQHRGKDGRKRAGDTMSFPWGGRAGRGYGGPGQNFEQHTNFRQWDDRRGKTTIPSLETKGSGEAPRSSRAQRSTN